MSSCPVEVVFSLGAASERHAKQDSSLFRYASGPVKVPGPWKRGRPKGSKSQTTKHTGSLRFEFVHLSPGSEDAVKPIQASASQQVDRNYKPSKDTKVRQAPGPGELAAQEDGTNMQKALAALGRLDLHQIAAVDPFSVFPMHFEPYMHDLLLYFSTTIWKQIYSLEKLAGYNPVTEYWLPLAFQDLATLHCFIGCAEAYTTFFTSLNTGTRGTWHLHEAISTVNRRLRISGDIVQSGTLVIIVGMAMVERGSGYRDNWRVHMQGLKHLVDACGGIRQFESQPMVFHKITRADLYGSIDDASTPYFGELCTLIDEEPPGDSISSDGFRHMHEAIGLDLTLRRCIHLLEEAKHLWNYAEGSTPEIRRDDDDTALNRRKPSLLEATRVRQLLTIVQYALISNHFQEFCAIQDSAATEACRIALILYSTTTLNERPPSLAFGISLVKKLQCALGNMGDGTSDHVGGGHLVSLPVDFQLWALVMATIAVTMPDPDTREWLRVSFTRLSSPACGNARSWCDLRSRLSRYLWVPSIHAEPARRLWLETEELRRNR